MTDEQLTKLADLIADRLINHRNRKDVAWHDKSPITIEDLLEDMPLSFQETPEEHMLFEYSEFCEPFVPDYTALNECMD